MNLIDVHTHIPRDSSMKAAATSEAMAKYFGSTDMRPSTPEGFLVPFDEARIDRMIIFNANSESATGEKGISNDYVANFVDKYPDRFIGFASVDPWAGKMAVNEIDRAIRDLHLNGLKMNPVGQAFFPNESRFHPLWEKCQELGIPVTFHCGMAARGAGMPGGGGFKLKYSNPIYLDDVAADFPDLKIIMAHPAFPWTEEQIAVALHKPNAFIDLSGWRPKYFPAILLGYFHLPRFTDKLMFGSDYPAINPKVWLEDFEKLEVRPEVREKILVLNAKKLLKL